jgi:hypothetical protein
MEPILERFKNEEYGMLLSCVNAKRDHGIDIKLPGVQEFDDIARSPSDMIMQMMQKTYGIPVKDGEKVRNIVQCVLFRYCIGLNSDILGIFDVIHRKK